MSTKVLFVDDDLFFGEYYVQALITSNMEVEVCGTVDDGISCFLKHSDLNVIVLDIMMPKPTLYAEMVDMELDRGHSTGIWFLRFLKAKIVERQTRVLILTNKDHREVQKMVDDSGFPNGLTVCYSKNMLPADKLANRIRALLNCAVD